MHHRKRMKKESIAFLLPALLFLNCFLFQENDETWLLEWRIYDGETDEPVKDGSLNFSVRIPGGMNGEDVLDTGKIDEQGFLMYRFYTYPGSFLKKDPELICKVSEGATMVLDTVFSWNMLGFRDQKVDTLHDYPTSNERMNDVSTEWRNVSKKRFFIDRSSHQPSR
jgi:hypothetical protein